jgi:hypothetical protein
MSDEKSEAGTRWWEQYYVRYFVGTFVGVAVIFALRDRALLATEIAKILPAFKDIDAAELTGVALAGLAYCYIASAPVLTVHAIRGDWASRSYDKHVWISVGVGYGLLAIAIAWLAVEGWASNQSKEDVVHLGSALVALIFLGQALLIGRALVNKFERVIDFYHLLSSKRTEERKQGRDFLESYKHLREHGNAMLIVLSEIALGLVLSSARTMTQFVCFVVLWILPASSSWFIGSALERSLTHTSGSRRTS